MAKIAADKLDSFDRKLLTLVQQNNQATHEALGAKVNLSASSVRRRLKQLRDSGVIARDVSILARDQIGVTLIVNLWFHTDNAKVISEFHDFFTATAQIVQAYHVAGTVDFILIVQAESLQWYETWCSEALIAHPDIRRVETHVVWSCRKFETAQTV